MYDNDPNTENLKTLLIFGVVSLLFFCFFLSAIATFVENYSICTQPAKLEQVLTIAPDSVSEFTDYCGKRTIDKLKK